VVDRLDKLKLKWPKPIKNISKIKIV